MWIAATLFALSFTGAHVSAHARPRNHLDAPSCQVPGDFGSVSAGPVRLVTGVLSLERAKRDGIRQTWARNSSATYFVVGDTVGGRTVMPTLVKENRERNDLIILRMAEAYGLNQNTLNVKTMAFLAVVDRYAASFTHALKTDDDSYVDLAGLAAKVHVAAGHAPVGKQYLGHVWGRWGNNGTAGVPVIRDPSNKWHVPEADWPASHYPRYCSGAGTSNERGHA